MTAKEQRILEIHFTFHLIACWHAACFKGFRFKYQRPRDWTHGQGELWL